jgi:D-alanine-D-alanine ligase
MRVALLHPHVPPDALLEDQDTLVQANAVEAALRELGHRTERIGCTLDLAALRRTVLDAQPDVVFNLAESLDGADSLQYLPPALLDTLGIRYTGNPTEAIFQTTHKLVAKQILGLAGLPTPAWMTPTEGGRGKGEGGGSKAAGSQPVTAAGEEDIEAPLPCPPSADPLRGYPGPLPSAYILKAVWEHASRGLDDANVIRSRDVGLVRARLADMVAGSGRPAFAEQFIEGREFNLAILDGPQGPELLPPAEIDFAAFPPGKPRIVGHRAKWVAGSFEFDHTPRSFDFSDQDRPLLHRIGELALACWRLFGLRGYARVDFRVDHQQNPWILEINTNPCLAPDAGFSAALLRAGISFPQAVQRIIDAATRGHGDGGN